MTIEEKIFQRKKPVEELLLRYGFRKNGERLQYEGSFLEGDFLTRISVEKNGKITGNVIDRMNEEEYAPLRAPGIHGPFVSSVRVAYEELLQEISTQCCETLLFRGEQANRITGLIQNLYGVTPDFPWQSRAYSSSGVFRHQSSTKWFALITEVKPGILFPASSELPFEGWRERLGACERVEIINLKIQEQQGEMLRAEPGIFPAYHMNHKSWISVLLEEVLPDQRILELVQESFQLTDAGKRKKSRTGDLDP